ncbi:MAG: glycosyltransferase family 2 protein [Eggerthellaceae bacterium]|nr:glycosyltransferase family 2 protein [Eggerthellaceae bacterium]
MPVYNVEDYLGWCLDSLSAQTCTDIEVVCVIDGATDGSRALAGRYASADPRFVIVDQANSGPSAARNRGIREASAPLVCFVDADDRLVPGACERIVAAFDETGADIVTFGATCYPASAGDAWLVEHLSPRDVVYDGFAPDLVFKEMSHPFSWRTACRRGFLVENGLFYDEGLFLGEDQAFHFAIYPRARKTLLLSDKLYDYRVVREGSQMDRLARDPEATLAQHVRIVRRILADWEAGGFLRRYPAEMVAWTVEYALVGIAKLPPAPRDRLLGELRQAWLGHFSEGELAALGLPWAAGKMVDAALFAPERFDGALGRRRGPEKDGHRTSLRVRLWIACEALGRSMRQGGLVGTGRRVLARRRKPEVF